MLDLLKLNLTLALNPNLTLIKGQKRVRKDMKFENLIDILMIFDFQIEFLPYNFKKSAFRLNLFDFQ